MKVWLKRIGIGFGALVLVVAIGGGVFVTMKTSAFDSSMDKVYSVPIPTIERSADAAVLAREKHALWLHLQALPPTSFGNR